MVDFNTPKGMKDYSGKEMRLRESVIEKIKKKYRQWGYQPLTTPVIEKIETLSVKSGDEIAGQLFKIENSELALRFDQTVGLARFAANNQMPKPYKRYIIANAYRREEPQKGRLREFLQADADIIGSSTMRCEAELLAMASESLEKLGFEGFEILINNRKILKGIVQKLEIKDKEGEILRALDKLDKIGFEGVREQLEKTEIAKEKIEELLNTILAKEKDENKLLETADKYSKEGSDELREILKISKEAYGLENIKIDFSLVRGLGYYTGPIFEIRASDEIGSVAGGGRYDDLCSLYGQKQSAVGISLGIERLLALKKKEKGQIKNETDCMIICLDEKLYKDTVRIASKMRDAGIVCETDLMMRKIKGQLDYANACEIPFVLIIGEREIRTQKLTLKKLATSEQKILTMEKIIEDITLYKELRK